MTCSSEPQVFAVAACGMFISDSALIVTLGVLRKT